MERRDFDIALNSRDKIYWLWRSRRDGGQEGSKVVVRDNPSEQRRFLISPTTGGNGEALDVVVSTSFVVW